MSLSHSFSKMLTHDRFRFKQHCVQWNDHHLFFQPNATFKKDVVMITGHWCKPTLNVDIIYKQCYIIIIIIIQVWCSLQSDHNATCSQWLTHRLVYIHASFKLTNSHSREACFARKHIKECWVFKPQNVNIGVSMFKRIKHGKLSQSISLSGAHPNLRNVTPPLISRNPRGRMCLVKSPSFFHSSLPYITCFDIK